MHRDYNEKNKSSFLNDLALMNWQDVYSTANTQCAFSLFQSKMIDLHDKVFSWEIFHEEISYKKAMVDYLSSRGN